MACRSVSILANCLFPPPPPPPQFLSLRVVRFGERFKNSFHALTYFLSLQTHAEAVRLDDYDELTNHRTSNSDLFRWIIHQASRGITDAQVDMRNVQQFLAVDSNPP